MRIDLNTGATTGAEKAATSSNPGAATREGNAAGARADTAKFLLDRIQAQALAPEPVRGIGAGKAKVEALRKVVADGNYRVDSANIAGAILAEHKRL